MNWGNFYDSLFGAQHHQPNLFSSRASGGIQVRNSPINNFSTYPQDAYGINALAAGGSYPQGGSNGITGISPQLGGFTNLHPQTSQGYSQVGKSLQGQGPAPMNLRSPQAYVSPKLYTRYTPSPRQDYSSIQPLPYIQQIKQQPR